MKDHFGREVSYLRMSVTERCNLRCRYCMPEDGICKKSHDDMLTEDEMITAVEAAASLGIKKLRITGGEPLVKKNIISICQRASAVDGIEELCITTNGTLLEKYADKLKNAGVSRLNISLDTLDEKKYAYMTRRGNLTDALTGIKAAYDAGFEHIKINAVLIGGFNDDEAEKLCGLTCEYPLDVRFIELMPMYDGGDFDEKAFITGNAVLKAVPKLEKTGKNDGVATLYRLPEAKGNVGIISAVSSHFCKTCNRIRLTADGKIKPCLHSAQEYPIKGLDLQDMKKRFAEAILAKPANHGPLSADAPSKSGRNMNQIGG